MVYGRNQRRRKFFESWKNFVLKKERGQGAVKKREDSPLISIKTFEKEAYEKAPDYEYIDVVH